LKNTAKTLIALEVLSAGGDVSQAAELANTSRQTIYKWLDDPEFSRELAKKQSEAVQRLSARFIALGDKALAAIEAGLNDRAISTRLRAASIYGSKYQSFIELGLLEQRITALERQALTRVKK